MSIAMVGQVLAWPDGSGVAGSLIISVVLGAPAYVRAMRASARRHERQLAQAAQHHREKMQADAVRHDELVAQADRHHQEQLDRQEVHLTAIQAHVTQQAAAIKAAVAGQAKPAEPVRLGFTGADAGMADALKKTVRARGSKPGGEPL